MTYMISITLKRFNKNLDRRIQWIGEIGEINTDLSVWKIAFNPRLSPKSENGIDLKGGSDTILKKQIKKSDTNDIDVLPISNTFPSSGNSYSADIGFGRYVYLILGIELN